jgi:hypothetical protein
VILWYFCRALIASALFCLLVLLSLHSALTEEDDHDD